MKGEGCSRFGANCPPRGQKLLTSWIWLTLDTALEIGKGWVTHVQEERIRTWWCAGARMGLALWVLVGACCWR